MKAIYNLRYEYNVIVKNPPVEGAEAQTAWIEQDQRKMFLGHFASRNLQRDYEDVVALNERATITFTTIVERLQARYRPIRNHLSNYEFRKLVKNEDESFDLLVNRIKHEAKNYQSSRINENCTIPQILMRDQIAIDRLKKPRRYSRKANQENMRSARNPTKPKCTNCS